MTYIHTTTHRTRPKLLVIPAIISAVLAAIGPIGYGGAVASQYPWKALEMDEMLSVTMGGADAASSDVATVRSGFAVAIVASATSFLGAIMLVYNLYFVRAASTDHGRELEVCDPQGQFVLVCVCVSIQDTYLEYVT